MSFRLEIGETALRHLVIFEFERSTRTKFEHGHLFWQGIPVLLFRSILKPFYRLPSFVKLQRQSLATTRCVLA